MIKSLKKFTLFFYIGCLFSFTFYDDLIEMSFGGESLDKPFLGGFNRPKIQWLDWDRDGDIDLFLLDASGYIRYLENKGNNSSPDFSLVTASFQNIFCGSWFYFLDFDYDGDLDLMAQNNTEPDYVNYFENYSGSFNGSIIIGEISGGYVVSSSVMTPTFADIDNDGDADFFTGNVTGTLTYYENIGLSNGVPEFQFITNSWQDIYIVGRMRDDNRHGASAITFIDLDGDGDLDLSWGDYFQQSLYIIWNSGTLEEPIMLDVALEYPPVDPVFSAGQNMPTFADLDGDGDEDLYVTVLSGAYGNQLVNNFFYYENIGSGFKSEFNYVTSSYLSTLDIFSNSSPELIDIDFDGDLDLFVANQYDLSESPWVGKIIFFRNKGSNSSPFFEEESTSLLDENLGQMLSPEFGDLDGDGDIDLIVGDFNGFIQYYENTSSGNSLSFEYIENIPSIDLSGNSTPTLGDLDGDGDLDLLIGQLNGELVFYRNIGNNKSYNFELENFDNIVVDNNSSPELVDIDQDGELDLILGSGNQGISIYINEGNSSNFIFNQSFEFEIPIIGVNTKPALGFLFNSDKIDLIVGVVNGGLFHLQQEVCLGVGDLNSDGGWNVLDIVVLANCVLANNCSELECAGDMNGDGGWNVLDIVALANCVLVNNCS